MSLNTLLPESEEPRYSAFNGIHVQILDRRTPGSIDLFLGLESLSTKFFFYRGKEEKVAGT